MQRAGRKEYRSNLISGVRWWKGYRAGEGVLNYLYHLFCFRCGWALKIQQQTFTVEFPHNLCQLLGDQPGAVALAWEIVVENEHGLFGKDSGQIGKPLAVG